MYAFDNRPSRYPKAAPIMSQLALLLPDNPGPPEFEPLPALLEADMSAAGDFIRDAAAASTRRAYRSDWRLFTAWCTARGAEPLPATPAIVAAFLAAEAHRGTKAATITRRAAAIRYAHRLAGHEPPMRAEAVRATMKGHPPYDRDREGAEGSGRGRSDHEDAGPHPGHPGRQTGPSADRPWLRRRVPTERAGRAHHGRPGRRTATGC
jgi:hypothetical protein